MRGKNRLGMVITLALLVLALGMALGEEAAEQVTGYFADIAYLRPEMVKTTETVDFIPAYTIVTMDVVDETWAVYTSDRGRTGYVNYSRLQPVPDYPREAERYVYGENRMDLRALPVYEAPAIGRLAENTLITVDGRVGRFLHVRGADGQEGYIRDYWVKDAQFKPKKMKAVTFSVVEETAALAMPLYGAQEMDTLRPEAYYRAEASYGNYYAIQSGDETWYVPKEKTAVFACKGMDQLNYFTLPRGALDKRTDRVENIYVYGMVGAEGAGMLQTSGEEIRLAPGEWVYVYCAGGAWCGVTRGENAGYIRRVELRLGTEIEEEKISGTIERSELLDQALGLLEEGNPFQRRYNQITGAEVRSLLSLGVPYFWGGRNYRTMTERMPKYATREAWQSSRNYYHKGTIYLYGYDCIGFVKGVYNLAGTPLGGSVTGLREEEFCLAGEHVYCDDVHPLPEDWTEAAKVMAPGDIMVIHHPGTHAMIYLGTLRDFGYTAESLPNMAKYLDYPLMIHSGENPYCYLRFRRMIETDGDGIAAKATPPDGGVAVCILGADPADADMNFTCHEVNYHCFNVEGSCVTIMGFSNVRDYFVYRRNESAEAGLSIPSGDDMEDIGDE